MRRAALKNTQLDISDVKETDAGKFICSTDKMSEGFTLLVVTSKHWQKSIRENKTRKKNNYSKMIELFFRADMMIKPTSMACPSRYDAPLVPPHF